MIFMERRYVTCCSGRVIVNVGQTLTSLIFFYMLSTGLDFLRFLKCDNFLSYVDMRKAGKLDWLLFTERPGSGWRLSQTPPGARWRRRSKSRGTTRTQDSSQTVSNCRERDCISVPCLPSKQTNTCPDVVNTDSWS